jgi:hypothetical protein
MGCGVPGNAFGDCLTAASFPKADQIVVKLRNITATSSYRSEGPRHSGHRPLVDLLLVRLRNKDPPGTVDDDISAVL